MSNIFTARFEILVSTNIGAGVWQIEGCVYDDSLFGYSAADAQVGDLVFDESLWYGTTDRWRITEIQSAIGNTLHCNVVWDDTGPPDENGPEACQGAICRPTTRYRLSETPSLAFSKISETLQNAIRNIDNRYIIDNIQGGSGYSASGYSGYSGYSGISGYIGYSGYSGYGPQGISGYSGYSGISGYSGQAAPQYIHTQYIATSVWEVNHNLNQRYVNVEVYDDADEVIIPKDIIPTDANNLQIVLSESFVGHASVIGGSSGTWGQSELINLEDPDFQRGPYDVSIRDFTKTFVCDSTTEGVLKLPLTGPQHLGKWIRFIKLGEGELRINAGDGSRIDNSSVEGSAECTEATVSVITLQLVKNGRWASVERTGNWNFL